MTRDDVVQAAPEATIARKEALPLSGQSGSPTPGVACQELETGRPLELSEVSPGRTVRHAHAVDGLLERPERFDALEELRPTVAELDPAVEDDPHLELRLRPRPSRHAANDSRPTSGIPRLNG